MLFFPPYIKVVVWAVFVLSGIGLLLIYVLPATSAGGNGFKGQPPAFQEAVQLTGVVKEFGSNRNGDIDQLLFSTPGGDTWVRFPPHTAKEVTQEAPKGTQATLWVNSGPPPPGPAGGHSTRYRLVQLQAGDAVVAIEDIPPPPPATGQPIEINGTVDSLVTGANGELSGLVVNGYRIILPPHLAHSLAPLLQQGKPILVKGYERSNDGFVNTYKSKLVKPYRMTIDSTDYLL